MSPDALARFDGVSLEDMVAEAALLARVDRKYVVPQSALGGLLSRVDERTRVLDIGGARRFAYESVYFDTPDLLSFHMAAQPRRRRFKLRTRTYVDTHAAYLEIKTRGARGTTVKERSEYDVAQRAVLTPEAQEEVAAAFAAIGVDTGRVDELDATLVTRYARATLLAPDQSSRATIDTDLRWDRPDGSGFSLPDLAIVETKSPSSASACGPASPASAPRCWRWSACRRYWRPCWASCWDSPAGGSSSICCSPRRSIWSAVAGSRRASPRSASCCSCC